MQLHTEIQHGRAIVFPVSTTHRGRDARGHDVLFFENEWSIRLAGEKNPGLRLSDVEPREGE